VLEDTIPGTNQAEFYGVINFKFLDFYFVEMIEFDRSGVPLYSGDPAYFDNPFLDAGLVSFLLERGVRTIGLDALNIDETPDADHSGEGFPAHHLIAEVGGVICENLCNLESVDFADPLVSLLPMKFVFSGMPLTVKRAKSTTGVVAKLLAFAMVTSLSRQQMEKNQ
jgi:hypothetical protein